MRAYGGKDPKQEFKREAFNMFEVLLSNIKNEIAKVVMLVEVKTEDQAKKIDQKNQQEVDKASIDSQSQDNQNSQKEKLVEMKAVRVAVVKNINIVMVY